MITQKYMELRLIIIYALNLFDLIMTKFWVNIIGIEFELNPIGKWILSDPALIILYKGLFVGFLLLVFYHFRDLKLVKIVSWILLAILSLLAIYHVVGTIYCLGEILWKINS